MIDFTLPGRLLSLSKSLYMSNHPDNLVLFNANIFTKIRGKVWYGDIDITRELVDLERLATMLEEELWVFRERDGSFEYETTPNWEKFVIRVACNGVVSHPKT